MAIACIKGGIAFHHAGLTNGDRKLVEELFRQCKVQVLCTTSTLAAGVNLPAHLVIIKSTFQYGPQGYQEYSELDILQMMGRAGRPQYDNVGIAVIITTDTKKKDYEDFALGTKPIESQY